VKLGSAGHYTAPASRVRQRAIRAEAVGWSSLWWPDAQMGYHPRPSPAFPDPHETYDWVPMLAVAADATERVDVGVAVTDPWRRHPALLAQTAQTLQDLSEGRFKLGLGIGALNNLNPIGLVGSSKIAALEEAVDIMQLLWSTTEPVDFKGEFWTLQGAVLAIDATQHGAPQIWIGGAGPRSLDLTARKADGWLPVMMPVEDYVDRLAQIRTIASTNGRKSDAVTAGALFLTIAADSVAHCRELLDTPWVRALALFQPAVFFERLGYPHPLGPGASGVRDFIPTHVSIEEYREIVRDIPLDLVEHLVLWGDAERISGELDKYEAAGLEHAVLWNVTGIGEVSADEMRASYATLSDVLAARC